MKPSVSKSKSPDYPFYENLLGPLLATDEGFDAEKLTQISLASLKFISKNRHNAIIANLLKKFSENYMINDERLHQNIFGCNFKNPLGLAAGFDKNGVAAGLWDSFGFGFAELGTITWHPQEGNPKPRLFRLAAEKAALNRLGFNNLGAKKLLVTLNKQKISPPGKRPLIIGFNLGKSKITPLEEAANDYHLSLELLAPYADYAVINVSSPNTPGLRSLQKTDKLIKLVKQLKSIDNCPPLLVKISPDLSNQEIDEISDVAKREKLDGIIAVNTALNRFGLEDRLITQTNKTLAEEEGGLSGTPLQSRALEVMNRLYRKVGKDLPLIGVGGIDSPKSAWERITAGASLIQIYTGWIFQGPILVPEILKGLTSQLEFNGFKNIHEAIGCKEPWR